MTASHETPSTDAHLERRFAAVARSRTFRNIIRTYQLDTKAVLDIGCAFGEYLAHFGKGSVGLTIADAEVAYGKVKGLDIRIGNIESSELVLPERFDVIYANNIFEHLYAPHSFLLSVKQYLKPGGKLILGVPCVTHLTFLMRHRKFRGALATQHINFFNSTTLALTAERAGWNVESVRGFHFFAPFIDALFRLVYPHFYVIATIDESFAYSDKRKKELMGYER